MYFHIRLEKFSTKRLYSSFGYTIMFRHKVNHMNFRVLIEKDEDGYFTVIVPSLPGCISQGGTEEEAKENIREAIVLHLESLAMAETNIGHHANAREAIVAVDL